MPHPAFSKSKPPQPTPTVNPLTDPQPTDQLTDTQALLIATGILKLTIPRLTDAITNAHTARARHDWSDLIDQYRVALVATVTTYSTLKLAITHADALKKPGSGTRS